MKQNYRKSSVVIYLLVLLEMCSLPLTYLLHWQGKSLKTWRTEVLNGDVWYYGNFWLTSPDSRIMVVTLIFAVITIIGIIAIICNSRKWNIWASLLELIMFVNILIVISYENTVSGIFNIDWAIVLVLLLFQNCRLWFATSSNSNNYGKVIAVGALLAVIFFMILAVASGTSGSLGGSSTTSKTCRSCGREFTDSSNTNSIARTHMCVNCYNNYEWGKDALDK